MYEKKMSAQKTIKAYVVVMMSVFAIKKETGYEMWNYVTRLAMKPSLKLSI